MKIFRHILSILTAVLIVVMAAGTVIEKLYDSKFAICHVYGTWWFIALWALAAVSMGVLLVLRKAWRQPVVFTLHLSVLLILLGALLTKLTGQHGEMTLQPGVSNHYFQIEKKGDSCDVELPFTLTLDRFEVVNHPGTHSPSDFVSHLHITDNGSESTEVTISMNNILKHKNYRFYQSDYDCAFGGSRPVGNRFHLRGLYPIVRLLGGDAGGGERKIQTIAEENHRQDYRHHCPADIGLHASHFCRKTAPYLTERKCR